MNGIKEALEYIVKMRKPEIVEVNGETYADKQLTRVVHNPKAVEIEMSTLTSLVEYIKGNVDQIEDKMIVHVVSPTDVRLYSSLDLDRSREYMVHVSHSTPRFDFGKFIDHETFCINIQSKFIRDDETDRELILKFAGTVEDGTVAQYGDDGVTQKATVKTGISSKADAVVPNPVRLRPYRTFPEVEQPASDFIFRMKSDKCYGIMCAVFEADGGAWKNEAMESIKKYLQSELYGLEQFTVIS